MLKPSIAGEAATMEQTWVVGSAKKVSKYSHNPKTANVHKQFK